MKTISILLIFTFFMLISIAHAYLDPGTGSMILQVLAAVGIGLFFVFKAFWGRIKSFFKSKKSGSELEEDDR